MTTPCTTPTPLRMATICSGIGAPEVASIGLPYEHVFMAEIEAFPSAVLAHHWPEVPNLGDMTRIDGESYCGQVDILVGGTPCQAFSVAGKRESLNDERGNLTLKFVELCDAINPAYVVWENVPGVLSTKDNALGCFLGALSGNDGELFPAGDGWSNAGCVIGPRRKLAWRILDAQYFGLAQRRRRVFVVACPRDGADPCEILFEREGVQRHSAPSREKGKGFTGVAGTLSANHGGLDRPAGNANELDFCVPVANYLRAKANDPHRGDTGNYIPVCMAHGQGNAEIVSDGSPSLTCNHEAPIAFHPTQDPIHSADGSCHALGCGSGGGQSTHAVAFHENQRAELTVNDTVGSLKVCGGKPGQGYPAVAYNVFGGNKRKDRPEGGFYVEENPDASKAMDAASGLNPTCSQGGTCCVDFSRTHPMAVRRLTPVECERLQGFPDSYTAIPWRNKPAEDCPDGPRYKALGNSMAVPVMRWILRRIADAD